MQVTIRLDDITPDMDWGKFRYFESVLDELNIKPIIGVVPNCEDETLHIEDANPDFWDEIRRLKEKGWIIAQHGYNHIYTTKKGGLFPLNHFSEYAGVDFDTQNGKIRRGRSILQSEFVDTDIFMAPGHTFDKKTIEALKDNRFVAITDGFGRKPYKRKGIIFYPIAERRSEVFKDKRDGRTTLIYHLNTMTYEQLEKEKAHLLENKDKLMDFVPVFDAPEQMVWGRIIEIIKANLKRILVAIKGR